MKPVVVATSKKWFRESFDKDLFPDKEVIFFETKNDLSFEKLSEINPEVVFFPHWNWIVEPKIYENFKCILFHIAPLPKFRGGSPIQNLIVAGYLESPLNALRMTKELDAGEVYCSKMISLEGSLKQIFSRTSLEITKMMKKILDENPKPKPQVGTPTYVKRRTETDNEVPINQITLRQFYDFIRMLDHEEYPNAFIEIGNFKFEFSEARLEVGRLHATVNVIQK
jgi:methionyl-tRNA formyltransferase